MATKIIVSNSTPLINFATINEIQILRKLFKQIIIPQAVWQEVVIRGWHESAPLSAITFAELMNGAKKSQRVEANVLRLNALGEILEICSFDQQAALVYGDVRSSLEKRGEVIGPHDLLIAAHALSLDRMLITNNEREFKRVEGLKVANWAVD